MRNDALVQTVTVVGIGADGWAGLAEPGRAAVRAAEVLLGGPRQLDLVAGHTEADLRPWPSPMLPALPGLFAELADRRVCVLASGDPMFHGIGATLARVLGPDRLHVVPHPSAVSLACARLGWAVDGVEVVSAVARPLARVRRVLAPGARVLVLSEDATTPTAVAGLLVDAGYGASAMTVLARLGAPDERTVQGTARDWVHPPGDPLNVVAVACVADPGAPVRAEVPGLPDDAYDHDGQLTKREVRAVTLAHLGPRPGELLWDVGAGNGSIAIEWLRAHRTCRAVAVESAEPRAARIVANAEALGRAVADGRAGQGPGSAGRAAGAGRRLHRWRDHDPGPARRLLGRAASGRPARGERRHAGGRGARPRRSCRTRRGPDADRGVPRARRWAGSPAGARRCR